MTAKERFAQRVKEFENDPDFIAEGLLLQINEEICRLMDQEGITRVEFARRLGVSRQFVTKLLKGNANVTLLTLVKIATALSMQLSVSITARQQEARQADESGWREWTPGARSHLYLVPPLSPNPEKEDSEYALQYAA